MSAASRPSGRPPPDGDMTVHNRLWLAWPPPWLRTAPWMPGGSAGMRRNSCSTGSSLSRPAPSSAAFRPLT
ncbi:Uncharacterised protein [Bordetella pertussis]|nr:Uncharacterised protein [Bordetella pertussis]